MYEKGRSGTEDEPGVELLVYLQEAYAEQALTTLRAQFAITQIASKQLVVVRVVPGQKDQVQSIEGVQGVFEGVVPESLYTHLDFSEMLFTRAWTIRHKEQPKNRPGEGLDWDAEGFEPPDISDRDWI